MRLTIALPGPATRSAIYRRFGALGPYWLLLPATAFFALFFAWPMVQALLEALQTREGDFTLDNFRRMIDDVNFGGAWRNTLYLIGAIVPLQLALALAMALLIQAGLRGSGMFLYIWAIPLGISDLAAGIVWLSVFTERGYFNSVLQDVGVIDRPFLFLSFENPETAFATIVIAELWRATSIVMIILVAGLQTIPRDYLEAADVFGAGLWRRLRYVILPLIRPSLQVALILRTILAFQVFAVVLVLTGRTKPVLAGEAFRWFNNFNNEHVAAAYAALILVASIVSTVIYLWALRFRQEQIAL